MQLETIPGVFAVADETKGTLSKHWLLVETRSFTDGETTESVIVCNCVEGYAHRVRLDTICSLIENETLNDFKTREETNYCKHCVVVKCLQKNTTQNVHLNSAAAAEVICSSPFAAVANGGSLGYGLIVAGHKQFKCQTCKKGACSHMDAFEHWNTDPVEMTDLEEAFSKIKLGRDPPAERFKCVSTTPVPWPVTNNFKKIKARVDRHGFPSVLEPRKPQKRNVPISRYTA